VAVAGAGEVGLAVARRWTPDFVLLDIGLPGIDGYEVARTLHCDPHTARVKIIGMSAYEPERQPEREQAARFDVRLVKPVAAERLLSALALTPWPGSADDQAHLMASDLSAIARFATSPAIHPPATPSNPGPMQHGLRSDSRLRQFLYSALAAIHAGPEVVRSVTRRCLGLVWTGEFVT
jgi:CheY-like chemotaxis protein